MVVVTPRRRTSSGNLGSALALRLGAPGVKIIIGSRDAEKAKNAVATLKPKLRAGELVGREAARRLGIPFGIIDLSLAPTPVPGDSVANIIEAMGFERAGTHGTTAALALLTDAVKKGGAMASSSVGGMSGAFIPVSEDAGMIEAARRVGEQLSRERRYYILSLSGNAKAFGEAVRSH